MREQTFREQEQSGEHQEGEVARIVGTHVAGGENRSTHGVIVVVNQPPTRQVDASGETIKDLPAIDRL
ncbi:hypothetical protein ACH0CA_08985 [Kytococcus sedentarius]|uniref:hypothetical protein n=1 Tax=Kytococcus sedentarius TaxID=1276 RepID=UPI0038792082